MPRTAARLTFERVCHLFTNHCITIVIMVKGRRAWWAATRCRRALLQRWGMSEPRCMSKPRLGTSTLHEACAAHEPPAAHKPCAQLRFEL